MEITEKNRNSNIELLRILSALAVIILHFNYGDGDGAISHVNVFNKNILTLLELICSSAVNIFLIITGYFNSNNTSVKISKIVNIVAQAISINLFFRLIYFIQTKSFSIGGIAYSLLPINYYVILYSSLILISPFINKLILHMNSKDIMKFICIVILIFSVYSTLVEIIKYYSGKELQGLSSVGLSGASGGYTIVNFIMMYLIGACTKRLNFVDKIRTVELLFALLFNYAILIYQYINMPNIALMYCNPFLILQSLCIFILFSKIHIDSKFINRIAPASYMCYLLHSRLLKFIDYSILENKRFLYLAVFIMIIVIIIYLVSILAMIIWGKLWKLTLGKIPLGIIQIDEQANDN